jgi:hypothetical protein
MVQPLLFYEYKSVAMLERRIHVHVRAGSGHISGEPY